MAIKVYEAAVDELRDDHWAPNAIGNTFRTTLYAVGSTNEALKSEQFDAAEWSAVNGTVTANAIAGPEEFGTDADLFVEANDVAAKHEIFQSITPGDSNFRAWSVFAKPAGRNFITLFLRDPDTGGETRLHVNLITGQWSVEQIGGGAGQNSLADGVYPDLGDGWIRPTLGGARPNNFYTDLEFGVYLGDAFESITYDGDGSSGVYLWGGQLEPNGQSGSRAYTSTTTASVSTSSDSNITLPSLPSTDALDVSFYVRGVQQYAGGSTLVQFRIGDDYTFQVHGANQTRVHSPSDPLRDSPTTVRIPGDIFESHFRIQDNGAGNPSTLYVASCVNEGVVQENSFDHTRATDFSSTNVVMQLAGSGAGIQHFRGVDQLRTLEQLRAEAGF